jgi:hypothetical protein
MECFYFMIAIRKVTNFEDKSLGHGASSGAQVVVGLDEVLQTSHNQIVVVAIAVNHTGEVPSADIAILVSISIVPSIN